MIHKFDTYMLKKDSRKMLNVSVFSVNRPFCFYHSRSFAHMIKKTTVVCYIPVISGPSQGPSSGTLLICIV